MAQNDNVTGCAFAVPHSKVADHVGFDGLTKMQTIAANGV